MKRIALAVLVLACLGAAAHAQAGLQPAAIVNLTRSEPIAVGQLRGEVERMERALGHALNVQQRREVLDAMINERLVLQAAERDRVTVSEAEVNQHINQLRAQLVPALGRQPTDAEFAQIVRDETGLDMPAFREQTRRQLIHQRYLVAQQQSVLESARPPTEAEIVSMFELTRAEFIRPEMVRISMILVPYGANAASRTAARQQADALVREIGSSSANFNAAVVRAQAPGSAFQGGDFGLMPRSLEAVHRMGQDFVNAAFSLRVGEVSGVIPGPVGYQIITVTESHAMRNLELGDEIHPGSQVTVRAYIANAMMQQNQVETLIRATSELHARLRTTATVQVFEANLNW
jgi:parvulin-like peptidyl-prolyl isomerase